MAVLRIARGVTACDDILADRRTQRVAGAIETVAPSIDYERPPPAYLDLRHATQTAREQLDLHLAQVHTLGRAIDLFRFTHAAVFGQGTVILNDSTLLLDSAVEFLNHQLCPIGSEAVGDGFAIRALSYVRAYGDVLLVKRPWYRNYGHWLVDLLPLLPLAAHAGATVDTVVFGDVPTPQIRAMMVDVAARTFPQARTIFVDDQTLIEADTLQYLRPVHVPPMFKHPPPSVRRGPMRVSTVRSKPRTGGASSSTGST